jgi:hypothetical protein
VRSGSLRKPNQIRQIPNRFCETPNRSCKIPNRLFEKPGAVAHVGVFNVAIGFMVWPVLWEQREVMGASAGIGGN